MALQNRQYDLQREAQSKQLEAQQREVQIADNAGRRSSLLERANSAAAQNEASLFGGVQQQQAALTDNVANTNKEKQKRSSAMTDASRTNLISQLTRTRSMYDSP